MKTLKISPKKRFVEQHKQNVRNANSQDHCCLQYKILVKGESRKQSTFSRSLFQQSVELHISTHIIYTFYGRKAQKKVRKTATSINKTFHTNNPAFYESYCSITNNNLCWIEFYRLCKRKVVFNGTLYFRAEHSNKNWKFKDPLRSKECAITVNGQLMEEGHNSLIVNEDDESTQIHAYDVAYFSGAIPFELSTSITVSSCGTTLFEKVYAATNQLVTFSTNLNSNQDLWLILLIFTCRPSSIQLCEQHGGIWNTTLSQCVQSFYLTRICYYVLPQENELKPVEAE